MGGKPSKGTPADQRLKVNKAPKMTKMPSKATKIPSQQPAKKPAK